MSSSNHTIHGRFTTINGQLVFIEYQGTVKAITDEELSGTYINKRKIPTPEFLLFKKRMGL